MKTLLAALMVGASILGSGACLASPSHAPEAQAEAIARAADLSANDVLVALGERRASYLWFVHRQDRVHSELRRALGEERYEEIFAADAHRIGDAPLAEAETALDTP